MKGFNLFVAFVVVLSMAFAAQVVEEGSLVGNFVGIVALISSIGLAVSLVEILVNFGWLGAIVGIIISLIWAIFAPMIFGGGIFTAFLIFVFAVGAVVSGSTE